MLAEHDRETMGTAQPINQARSAECSAREACERRVVGARLAGLCMPCKLFMRHGAMQGGFI
jgi:hypothetical protein